MLDRELIINRAINTYGKTLQTVIAMEELSELIKELSKTIRGQTTKTQVLTEMSDVYIMLEELKIIFNITQKELDEEIDFKLTRLNNRINESEEEE